MNEERRWALGLLVGGLASAGLVAAHVLAYLVVAPEPHHRALLLDSTGHRHWSLVVIVALGALVAGMVNFVSSKLRSRDPAPVARGRSIFGLSVRFAALQVTGFLLLEALERLGSHGSANLLGEPAVRVGIVLQIAIAIAAALLVLLFTKAVDLVLSRLTRPRSPSVTPLHLWTTRSFFPLVLVACGAGSTRGPPAIS